jgi:hypothetical protein
MKPLVIVKDNKQTEVFFTALLNDQKTEIRFEIEDHEIINDTLKIVARYSEDHYTIINKQNITVRPLLRIKKMNGSFDNYPIRFPTKK